MDPQRAFQYQFEDKEWISKLGLGALISLIPILNFAWNGYMVAITRNVMSGAPAALPSWDDLGKRFTDGLMLTLAWFVYGLPMMLLLCLPMSALLVSGAISANSDFQQISDALLSAGGLVFAGLLCVFFAYALVLGFFHPAIQAMYAREGTFASCFKFREIIDLIRQHGSEYLITWGVSLLANMAISMVMSLATGILNIIPCVGTLAGMVLMFAGMTYTLSVSAHLIGQFGRIAWGAVLPSTSTGPAPAS